MPRRRRSVVSRAAGGVCRKRGHRRRVQHAVEVCRGIGREEPALIVRVIRRAEKFGEIIRSRAGGKVHRAREGYGTGGVGENHRAAVAPVRQRGGGAVERHRDGRRRTGGQRSSGGGDTHPRCIVVLHI